MMGREERSITSSMKLGKTQLESVHCVPFSFNFKYIYPVDMYSRVESSYVREMGIELFILTLMDGTA